MDTDSQPHLIVLVIVWMRASLGLVPILPLSSPIESPSSTGLHETDSKWEFALAPNLDLYCIEKYKTGMGKTEVHVLSKESNYQRLIKQILHHSS